MMKIIILSLFIILLTLHIIRRIQINRYLNDNFGVPLKQFNVRVAWNYLAIRNSPTIIVSFYEKFLVIKYLWSGKEFIVPREQSEIKTSYGLWDFIIEIPVETVCAYKRIQLTCFKGEKEQFFLDYFNL